MPENVSSLIGGMKDLGASRTRADDSSTSLLSSRRDQGHQSVRKEGKVYIETDAQGGQIFYPAVHYENGDAIGFPTKEQAIAANDMSVEEAKKAAGQETPESSPGLIWKRRPTGERHEYQKRPGFKPGIPRQERSAQPKALRDAMDGSEKALAGGGAIRKPSPRDRCTLAIRGDSTSEASRLTALRRFEAGNEARGGAFPRRSLWRV